MKTLSDPQWPNLPSWLEFILTIIGSSTATAFAMTQVLGRKIRRVASNAAASDSALADRLLKLELAVGNEIDGGGLHSKLTELKEMVLVNRSAEHRHYNRLQKGMTKLGYKARVDLSGVFEEEKQDDD